MLIRNVFFVFKTLFGVKEYFPHCLLFIKFYESVFTFKALPPNENYKLWLSGNLCLTKRQFRTWSLSLSGCSFSVFWRAEKHLFLIAPFCVTRYVLNNFGCLEDSNREALWIKSKKKFRWVNISNIQIGNTTFHKEIYFWVLILKINFMYCFLEIILVAMWNKGKSRIFIA